MANGSFSFDTTGFKSVKEMDRKLNRALFATAKYWDGRTEAHMKHKAPWSDRTTNARSGLSSKAVKLDSSTFAIILSHAVTYGIYLETRWNGRYAIILPTMRLFSPKVMQMLNHLLDRLK